MRKREIFKFVIAAKKSETNQTPAAKVWRKEVVFFLLGKFAKRVREKGMAANWAAGPVFWQAKLGKGWGRESLLQIQSPPPLSFLACNP